METLRRWREPAVIVVLALLVVRLLLVLGAGLVPEAVGVESSVDAAYVVSDQLADATLFVVLAALVGACHLRPATAHARTLTLTALLVTGLALVVVLVLAGLGYASFPSPLRRIELASRLLGLVLPALAVGTLALLVTRSAAVAGAADKPTGREIAASAGDQASAHALPASAPDPEMAPTWPSDTATGAAWWSAGDAASGRPAATSGHLASSDHSTEGWGALDQRPGDQPALGQPAFDQPSSWDDPGQGALPPRGLVPQGDPVPTDPPPHPWSRP